MAAEEPAAAATTWPRSSDSSASVPARHSSSNSQLASCQAQLASLASAQPAAEAGALRGSSSPPRPSGALAPCKGAEADGPPAATSTKAKNEPNEPSGAKKLDLKEKTGGTWTFCLQYALALATSLI